MTTTTATTTAANVTALIAPWSDPVELVEFHRRSLEREHLKRETPVEVVQARLALETLQDRCFALSLISHASFTD